MFDCSDTATGSIFGHSKKFGAFDSISPEDSTATHFSVAACCCTNGSSSDSKSCCHCQNQSFSNESSIDCQGDSTFDSSDQNGSKDQLKNSSTSKLNKAFTNFPGIKLTKIFAQSMRKSTSGEKQFQKFSSEISSKEKSMNGKTVISRDAPIFSTMGLILESRPSNLPPKPINETAKHEAEHNSLIEQAKRREMHEANERKRLITLQRKAEEDVASACREWCQTILPNWDVVKKTKRCQELWWRGIPPKIRGHVWALVIELYKILCKRAQQYITSNEKGDAESSYSESVDGFGMSSISRENSLRLIHLDVSRTFPSLGIFQQGGPYYDLLFELLGAYACYRPDIGYVQSMSFIAAVLLLQLEPYASFIAFANLLNKPLQLAFFGVRQSEMAKYFMAYDRYFSQELPKLHAHFTELDVRADLYLVEWLYTIYSKSLPLDVTCRIWDVFLRDGEEFLFKTALGILNMYGAELLKMDFDDVVWFLTHLPGSISDRELFQSIKRISSCNSLSSSKSARNKKSFIEIYEDISKRFIAESNTFDSTSH